MGAVIRYRDHAGNDTTRNEVVMFADIRAFIMGVEVSDYIVGDISVNRAEKGNDGTCSFSLDNNFDRFIIRPENLGGVTPKYDYNQGTGNPLPSFGNIITDFLPTLDPSKFSWISTAGGTNAQRGTYEYDETAKKELFEYKYRQVLHFDDTQNQNASVTDHSDAVDSNGNPTQIPAGTKLVNTASLGDVTRMRYDLSVGACVVHLNDEVRVWVADPNSDPQNDYERLWMPLFSGVVSTAPVSTNRLSGESTVAVTCSDVRYLLRKQRLGSNIQSADQKQLYIEFNDAIGMFQDVIERTDTATGSNKFENSLSQLSYREITRVAICGDNPSDIALTDAAFPTGHKVPTLSLAQGINPYATKISTAGQHQFDASITMQGTGTFTLGVEIPYDVTASDAFRVSLLENWNDIVLFGIKGDWHTDSEVDIIGGGTRPIDFIVSQGQSVDKAASQPSPFSVMNGFVHYLFPGAQTGAFNVRNAIERAILTPANDANWTNRLDVLTQSSETLDYQFYVSPMGDFVFEFPMYDFQPNAFGKYAECYTVGDSIKSDEHNDEGDGNVITGLMVTGAYSDAQAGSNAPTEKVTKDLAYTMLIKSDFMAAKYGIAVEEYQIPWLHTVWTTESTDTTGAQVDTNTLQRNTAISFGLIEFFKRIAAMSSMNYSGCYNPFLLPNRPCLNTLQRRIGLTVSCSLSIPVGGAPSSTVETFFVRKADNTNTFLSITGAPNTPFSYASPNGLSLFSTTGLENIRTTFGVEILDTMQSLNYNELHKAAVAGGSIAAVDTSNYGTVGSTVARRAKQWAALLQSNPALTARISTVAQSVGMDPFMLYQIMMFESGMNPQKTNSIGAIGVIQFTPDTLSKLNPNIKSQAQFLKDYPTVDAQLTLVQTYLQAVQTSNKTGPLDTPYKAYMAVFNPAMISVPPTTPWAQTGNTWTVDHASSITSENGGATAPADLMTKLGYDYSQQGVQAAAQAAATQGNPNLILATTSATGPLTTLQKLTPGLQVVINKQWYAAQQSVTTSDATHDANPGPPGETKQLALAPFTKMNVSAGPAQVASDR